MKTQVEEAEENKNKGKRGFLGPATAVIIGVITIVLLLVVANVMLGYLDVINESSLGNNSNATAAIEGGFALLSVTLGIITLLVVVALLWLVVSIFIGGGFMGGDTGGGGRRRGRR